MIGNTIIVFLILIIIALVLINFDKDLKETIRESNPITFYAESNGQIVPFVTADTGDLGYKGRYIDTTIPDDVLKIKFQGKMFVIDESFRE